MNQKKINEESEDTNQKQNNKRRSAAITPLRFEFQGRRALHEVGKWQRSIEKDGSRSFIDILYSKPLKKNELLNYLFIK